MSLVGMIIGLTILAIVMVGLIPQLLSGGDFFCEQWWKIKHKDFDADRKGGFPPIHGSDACDCDANKNAKLFFAAKDAPCTGLRYRQHSEDEDFFISDTDYPDFQEGGQAIPEACRRLEATAMADPETPDCWTPSASCEERIATAAAEACDT